MQREWSARRCGAPLPAPDPGPRVPNLVALTIVAACVVLAACGGTHDRGTAADSTGKATASDSTLLVMNAASITQPMTAALDSFAARTGAHYHLEPGSSLEIARRITELGRRPNVLALADPEVFPQLLMPRWTTWYALFGRNRMVLAYTDRSKYASQITPANWRQIIQRPGVQVGRSDPNDDPSGYRTLFVFQLAARYYHQPSLATKLLAAAPQRNVRPREADQVGLLQAGELDYTWSYQNLADNAGLKTVALPPEIDLGTASDSTIYKTASARVTGKSPGDTITVRGAPILFAVSVSPQAPHVALGDQFVAFLLSPDGQRILRGKHFDALDSAIVIGSGAPAGLGPAK